MIILVRQRRKQCVVIEPQDVGRGGWMSQQNVRLFPGRLLFVSCFQTTVFDLTMAAVIPVP